MRIICLYCCFFVRLLQLLRASSIALYEHPELRIWVVKRVLASNSSSGAGKWI